MEINISIVSDTLSEEELKKLMQCIREIEQNKPKRLINIFINSPEKTTEEVKNVLSSIKPGFPFMKVIPFDKEEKMI